MKFCWLTTGFLLLVTGSAGGVADKPKAQLAKRTPLPAPVRKAVQAGINYLRTLQRADGSWEVDEFAKTRPGGWTCLTMLALLEARVPPNDPAIQKGLAYVRQLDPDFVYVRALQTMVFAKAGGNKNLIQRNVDWLIKARVTDNTGLLGWTYKAQPQVPDNSNTSFAVAGLHAGRGAGAKIPTSIWKEIRSFYQRTQQKDGGWVYATHHNHFTYLTMDLAGLTGLLTAGMALGKGPEIPQKNGKAILAQVRSEAVERGLRQVRWEFTIELKNRIYYNIYGISHLGRLSGLRFLGMHDWYRKGCDFLLKEQANDGSWPGKGFQFDKWPLINTSFAVIFLANPP
jgi:hypothetical protein